MSSSPRAFYPLHDDGTGPELEEVNEHDLEANQNAARADPCDNRPALQEEDIAPPPPAHSYSAYEQRTVRFASEAPPPPPAVVPVVATPCSGGGGIVVKPADDKFGVVVKPGDIELQQQMIPINGCTGVTDDLTAVPQLGRRANRFDSNYTGSVCEGFNIEHKPAFQSCSSGVSTKQLQEDLQNAWAVNFKVNIFIEEFFVHLFGAFAYPYLCIKYSVPYAQNHELVALIGRGATGFWVWVMFVFVNVCYVIYGPSKNVTTSEIMIASLMFLSRNCIIAAKYAYLSPFQLYDRKRRYIPTEEMSKQLLLSGWLNLQRDTMSTEIDYAFKRLGIRSSEKSYATFVGWSRDSVRMALQQNVPDDAIPEQYASWKDQRDQGRLHIRLLCQRFVTDAVDSISFKRMSWFVLPATFVHCMIPTLSRGVQGENLLGNNWYNTCQIFMCFMISFPNFAASLMFVLVGLIDYRRRIFLMHRCAGLLVDSYLIEETAKSIYPYSMPLLNFSKANNVGIWLETRQVFKDFGLQFFKRVQAYASFWVLCVLCMLGFLFYQLFFQKVAETTGIIMISYDLIVVAVVLFLMMTAARKLNHQHVEHRKILLNKLSEMQRHISLLSHGEPTSQKYAESVLQSKKMVKVAIQVIETDDELSPVRILGFDANDNLTRALVTAAGSGLFAAAKVLLA